MSDEYPGLADSPPRRCIKEEVIMNEHSRSPIIPSDSWHQARRERSSPSNSTWHQPFLNGPQIDEESLIRSHAEKYASMMGSSNGGSSSYSYPSTYYDPYKQYTASIQSEPVSYFNGPKATPGLGIPARSKKPALVGDAPLTSGGSISSSRLLSASHGLPHAPPTRSSAYGLGVGKYGNEIPSPLDAEIRHTILEMQQELAFVDTLPEADNLRHSKRLLSEQTQRLEHTVDPDWLEVDINKPIMITKRVLIPTFRNPTFNYVGRIIGEKGSTLRNICTKFKVHVSIMGSGSTKDRAKEVELLNSGDSKFAHYASPLHIKVDTVAPAHVAHMRIAGCLNVFRKLLIAGKDVHIEGISTEREMSSQGKRPRRDDEEVDELELAFNYEDDDQKRNGSSTRGQSNYSSQSQQRPKPKTKDREDGWIDCRPQSGPQPGSSQSQRGGMANGRGRGGATRGRSGGFVPRVPRNGSSEQHGES